MKKSLLYPIIHYGRVFMVGPSATENGFASIPRDLIRRDFLILVLNCIHFLIGFSLSSASFR